MEGNELHEPSPLGNGIPNDISNNNQTDIDINEDHKAEEDQTSNGESLFVPQSDNVTVKEEPLDETWKIKKGELINLLSDDEGHDDITSAFATRGSPFKPQTEKAPDRHDSPIGHTSDNEVNMDQPHQDSATQDSNVTTQMLRQQMLEKQRSMANKFRTQKAANGVPNESGPGADPEHDTDSTHGISEVTASRGRKGRGKDPAAAKFEKLKQLYLKKKAAKALSIEDEINFMKAESDEATRLRKLAADDEYDQMPSQEEDDENSLFVREVPTIPSYQASDDEEEEEPEEPKKRSRKRAASENGDDEPSGRRVKRKPNAKKVQKVAETRYTEDDFDSFLSSVKQRTGPKPKSKKNATTKANSRKKSGPNMTNMGSIFGTDVFKDTAKTAGLADQPTFEKGSRRDKAMAQLIASVPEENMKVAKSDKKFLDDAIKAFNGHASVKPEQDGTWLVQGMKTSLKHYQVLGTAFMLKRENSDHLPKGGILADQMGLGKTIMTLACIINGKAKAKSKVRTTLIIASPALVNQWDNEIQAHCARRREGNRHGIGRVVQYRSGSRMKSNDTEAMLEEADIVLTTYYEVCKSYPKVVLPASLTTAQQKDSWWRAYYEEHRGILHRIKFHRVILDEAQAIKNHRSHTSMACRALDCKHPWAITGTPVLNTVREFYAYFKFLKEPHTGSYKAFKQNFCTPEDPDGTEKLGIFLRKLMIRRTHLDTLFNARLLDLPQPKEHTLWLEFNEVERQIYEIVKKRFIQRINTISKQGGLEKQYNHIWSMILRLRQICGHTLLVQGTVIDLLEREDFEKLNKITKTEEEMSDEGGALLMHLRNTLKSNTGVKTIEGGMGGAILTENEVLPTGVIDIGSTEGKLGGKHGLSFRFRKYLDSLVQSEHWEVITQRTLCCGCRQPPESPIVTSCFHIYCNQCLGDLQHLAARRGHDQARCSECGEAYTYSQPCEGFDTFEKCRTTTTSTGNGPVSKKPSKNKRNEPAMDWISMPGEVCPSAKTAAVKAQIMNWRQEDQKVKIIIYTQFLDMIRILGRVCQGEKWEYLEYSGKQNHDQRDKALQDFKDSPEKNILLASLKCGGLGLNLTMASRVICVDPWWNNAIENQAFCRVFRIGQDQPTALLRVVVKNSIDAAMMAMKERKQKEIDEVMQDAKKKDDLTVQDLMRLFGQVGDDGEGRPFIFPDQDDLEPEHLRLANVDEEDEERFMGNEE